MVIELTASTFDELADKLGHAGYNWAVDPRQVDLRSLAVVLTRRTPPELRTNEITVDDP
jgi:hypothetical protein